MVKVIRLQGLIMTACQYKVTKDSPQRLCVCSWCFFLSLVDLRTHCFLLSGPVPVPWYRLTASQETRQWQGPLGELRVRSQRVFFTQLQTRSDSALVYIFPRMSDATIEILRYRTSAGILT